MSPDALPFFLGQGGRNNKRVDTTPALEAARRGSVGFDGLGRRPKRNSARAVHLPLPRRQRVDCAAARQSAGSRGHSRQADDGDHRPGAGRVRPARRAEVGRPGAAEQHSGARRTRRRPAAAPSAYGWRIVRDGRLYRDGPQRDPRLLQRADPASLVPELPAAQKEALRLLRESADDVHQRAHPRLDRIPEAGRRLGTLPGMYHTTTSLDFPVSPSAATAASTTPDEPIVVHLVRNPNKPGLPRTRAEPRGQQELLSMSFEPFELEIRRQLARMLAGGGFDPAADIVGIHRQPMAARLRLHLRHARGSRRAGRAAAARGGPSAVRPHRDRQLRRRRGGLHQPGDRRSAPRRPGAARRRRAGVNASSRPRSEPANPDALNIVRRRWVSR